MIAPDVHEEMKRQYVIEQLAKFNYTDVTGKSYDELKRRLAILRSIHVDITAPDNKWF